MRGSSHFLYHNLIYCCGVDGGGFFFATAFLVAPWFSQPVTIEHAFASLFFVPDAEAESFLVGVGHGLRWKE